METPTRRTVGARVRGRSARVVEAVLQAAAAEFTRSGYEGFRVDAVASAAGVNKTSVYRRWPTKVALIAGMLRTYGAFKLPLPDTGSLRGDLRQIAMTMMDHYGSAHYRGVLTMLLSARDDAQVRELCSKLREEHYARYDALVQRAIARGELSPNVDGRLIIETVLAPISQRNLKQQDVPAAFVDGLIDLVVRGAQVQRAS